MEAQELDALVVRLPENVLLLSGHWPMIGAAYLVFPREGAAVCIMPDCYRAETLASLEDTEPYFIPFGGYDSPNPRDLVKAGLQRVAGKYRWKRVGWEGNFEANAPSWNAAEALVPAAATHALLQSAMPDAELVDCTALIQKERLTKTAYEAEKLDIVSEISCFGMEAFEEAVRVGVTGTKLVAVTEEACLRKGTGYRGAVRVRAFAQVTTGAAETAMAHRPNIVTTARHMQDGDFAVLELGIVADGYWGDRTRARIAGTPRDEQIRIYETVKRAQEAGVAAIKPGILARDADAAARRVIEEAGYGKDFPHITGHGLGFGYHEHAPILGPHSDMVLEAGMLTSVEPGIYTAAFGGVRIEDDVLVTDTGSRVLGPYRKNLQ